eukprot:1146529-Pleurochrysis_carterae.AAC.1
MVGSGVAGSTDVGAWATCRRGGTDSSPVAPTAAPEKGWKTALAPSLACTVELAPGLVMVVPSLVGVALATVEGDPS